MRLFGRGQYGFTKIYHLMFIKEDVTERILESADVGVDSIKALGAELPFNRQEFLVEISDSALSKSAWTPEMLKLLWDGPLADRLSIRCLEVS